MITYFWARIETKNKNLPLVKDIKSGNLDFLYNNKEGEKTLLIWHSARLSFLNMCFNKSCQHEVAVCVRERVWTSVWSSITGLVCCWWGKVWHRWGKIYHNSGQQERWASQKRWVCQFACASPFGCCDMLGASVSCVRQTLKINENKKVKV